MPAPPPPRNAFGRFIRSQAWTHDRAAAVLGISVASISRLGAGKQGVPPVLRRLIWLIERHPGLVAELVDFTANDTRGGS
jgi:hypothetical protein